MQRYDFKSYLSNLNRVNLVELIDNCQAELRFNTFRASLVQNPVTGLAYGTLSPSGATPAHSAGG